MSRSLPIAFRLSISLTALVVAPGCDSWVEDVEPSGRILLEDQLTREDHVDLLIKGVLREFYITNSSLALAAAALSDELVYDERNPRSSNVDLKVIDEANIPLDHRIAQTRHSEIGQLRFLADDLIRRISEIEFQDSRLRQRAAFTGYFYGAIARFYLAAYFGLTEREGGGVISVDPENPGFFTPSDQMYRLALEKLDLAATAADGYQASNYDARIAHTLKARINLILGDLSAARAAADSGMRVGDESFASRHSFLLTNNAFWDFAGTGTRLQLLADSAYKEYVDADSAEAGRLPMVEVLSSDSTITFYRQNRYTGASDWNWFCTWQENELILAEIEFIEGNPSAALMHVNAVRSDHGLDELSAIDMTVLEDERRKELWLMGIRLIDQRRFGTWHKGPGSWWNLPIPQNERDLNPNL